ncbi:hypothetical protein BKA57DRAFT_503002 [Linnemannia elongata]|nr:hypothetical protein BKA57DRAFT_503002 [Linnemannia elongata]
MGAEENNVCRRLVYTPSTGTNSTEHTIVIDKLGEALAYISTGHIFASTGYVTATVPNNENAVVLNAHTNVQVKSIKLTEEAVPATMTTTGYILDKAPANSTAIYAITPETWSSFPRVDIKCGSPPSKSYAAKALNKQNIPMPPPFPATLHSTFSTPPHRPGADLD